MNRLSAFFLSSMFRQNPLTWLASLCLFLTAVETNGGVIVHSTFGVSSSQIEGMV